MVQNGTAGQQPTNMQASSQVDNTLEPPNFGSQLRNFLAANYSGKVPYLPPLVSMTVANSLLKSLKDTDTVVLPASLMLQILQEVPKKYARIRLVTIRILQQYFVKLEAGLGRLQMDIVGKHLTALLACSTSCSKQVEEQVKGYLAEVKSALTQFLSKDFFDNYLSFGFSVNNGTMKNIYSVNIPEGDIPLCVTPSQSPGQNCLRELKAPPLIASQWRTQFSSDLDRIVGQLTLLSAYELLRLSMGHIQKLLYQRKKYARLSLQFVSERRDLTITTLYDYVKILFSTTHLGAIFPLYRLIAEKLAFQEQAVFLQMVFVEWYEYFLNLKTDFYRNPNNVLHLKNQVDVVKNLIAAARFLNGPTFSSELFQALPVNCTFRHGFYLIISPSLNGEEQATLLVECRARDNCC